MQAMHALLRDDQVSHELRRPTANRGHRPPARAGGPHPSPAQLSFIVFIYTLFASLTGLPAPLIRSRSGQPGLSSVWLSQTLDRYAPRCTAARANAYPARHRAVRRWLRLLREFRGSHPPGWRARLMGVAPARSGSPWRSCVSSLRLTRTRLEGKGLATAFAAAFPDLPDDGACASRTRRSL